MIRAKKSYPGGPLGLNNVYEISLLCGDYLKTIDIDVTEQDNQWRIRIGKCFLGLEKILLNELLSDRYMD